MESPKLSRFSAEDKPEANNGHAKKCILCLLVLSALNL